MAYVQENNLYIQDVAQSQPARLVDECEVERCLLLHLRWSPDGEYLLYFHGATTAAGDTSNEIRLVSKLGTWRTITNEAEAWRPAAWSPTGEQFAYLADTGQISEVEEGSSDQPLPLVELYTVEMGAEGELNEPELIGPLTLTQPGCGGGGRSASEELYELEAGTAYGYYSKVLAWTAQDILLFTLDCANTSIGRYDLATAAQLEPYAQTMRNLVLTADSSAWIAITGFPGDRNVTSYELVTGDPTETTIENIPTSRPVELVFSGRSGALYYTSRIRTDQVSLNEGAGPNFNFYETTLWQMDVDGANETALYVAADLALAHVQEAKDGALLFVRIENDRPLLEAVQSGVPQAQWPEYYPQRHIMLLRQDGAEPLQLVDNAGFVAVSQ